MSLASQGARDAAAATALFLLSAAWFTSIQRRPSDRESRRRNDALAAAVEAPSESHGRLSDRGTSLLKPAMSYLDRFFRCLDDPCHPANNPRGYVALCIAENKLSTEMLRRRLTRTGTAEAAFSDSAVYGYSGFLGLPAAREAFAYFLARMFLRNDGQTLSKEEALGLVSPERLSLGSGCASLISHICYSLASEGDAVLIPAPYYAAFESDMKAIAGCVAFPVQMTDPVYGPSIEDLDVAAKKAEQKGLHLKLLLLTNPNNPLGTIYEPHVLLDCIRWARNKNLHTIVDEIYALSVHKQCNRFQSVLKILNNELGDDVHMLWALSKDFAASGFRIGVLYTHNTFLLQTLATLNVFSGVSHPMQMIMSELLADDNFVDSFLREARVQIVSSLRICTQKLEEMAVPFVPPEAGVFVYCDFSSLLPSRDYDGEERFMALVEEAARIVMTPGQAQRDRKPGMMRICYAWVSPEVLVIGMERLSRLVATIRRIGWNKLDSATVNVLE